MDSDSARWLPIQAPNGWRVIFEFSGNSVALPGGGRSSLDQLNKFERLPYCCAFALLAMAARGADTALVDFSKLQIGSFSVYSENDKYLAGTDRYYTNGFRLSFLSTNLRDFTSGPVPGSVQEIARLLGSFVQPGNEYKLGLALGQNIYTPVDTEATAPLPNDRPYAAWLYTGVTFQSYRDARERPDGTLAAACLDSLEVDLGVVGPAAIGRQIQNGVHALIGAASANGWDNQIHDEPGLDVAYTRKYRLLVLGARDGWGAEFIPHAGVSLGNIFTYADAGAEFRAGWRLPADFGTDPIHPSGDSNGYRPPWNLFVFGATDGRAVARDITLDGNTFRSSAHVRKEPLVADYLGGVGIGFRHWQITYAEDARTREFYGQLKSFVFGSISATFFY